MCKNKDAVKGGLAIGLLLGTFFALVSIALVQQTVFSSAGIAGSSVFIVIGLLIRLNDPEDVALLNAKINCIATGMISMWLSQTYLNFGIIPAFALIVFIIYIIAKRI